MSTVKLTAAQIRKAYRNQNTVGAYQAHEAAQISKGAKRQTGAAYVAAVTASNASQYQAGEVAMQKPTEVLEREARQREEREMDAMTGADFTQAELRAAFNLVCNIDNWKMPIDAYIHSSMIQVVQHAVRHFAGCEITVAGVKGQRLRITAVGYYAAVGA